MADKTANNVIVVCYTGAYFSGNAPARLYFMKCFETTEPLSQVVLFVALYLHFYLKESWSIHTIYTLSLQHSATC